MENNKTHGQRKISTTLFVCILISAITIGSVVGATVYVLVKSNSIQITVNQPASTPVPITLTATVDGNTVVNGGTMTDVQSIVLTATTGPNGNGLSVTFYDNGVAITGSQKVITGSMASFTVVNPTDGSHTYTARP